MNRLDMSEGLKDLSGETSKRVSDVETELVHSPTINVMPPLESLGRAIRSYRGDTRLASHIS